MNPIPAMMQFSTAPRGAADFNAMFCGVYSYFSSLLIVFNKIGNSEA
jgi:hypothetical protein